ncbi:winged helix-turn-helix domain-containing protein [Gemmobacter sp. 24YEA27]|uniref:winged helix-turn-helix domain-containing protein n=1 Tax=Gemmobacter sp. 24YEA27 TaxID=3040672 RepID=UPI0024B32B35|nr:winged helix-turn-helix domain-containing protein [Gemmobacter sp. 24YEA27]
MARPTAVPRNFATLQSLQVARGTTRRDSLYAALVALINEGMFSSGDALPSTRQLAEQLSLSRNTVISAYRRLVLDGLASSEERSVFRVSEMVRPGKCRRRVVPGPCRLSRIRESQASRDRSALCRASIRIRTGVALNIRSSMVSATPRHSRPQTGALFCGT